jgi:hypothetical protein
MGVWRCAVYHTELRSTRPARNAFEKSFASKTVVAKLIELGYLNNKPMLTNRRFESQLRDYKRTFATTRQSEPAFKHAMANFKLNEPTQSSRLAVFGGRGMSFNTGPAECSPRARSSGIGCFVRA